MRKRGRREWHAEATWGVTGWGEACRVTRVGLLRFLHSLVSASLRAGVQNACSQGPFPKLLNWNFWGWGLGV